MFKWLYSWFSNNKCKHKFGRWKDGKLETYVIDLKCTTITAIQIRECNLCGLKQSRNFLNTIKRN